MGDASHIAWEARPDVVVRHAWPWDAWDLAPFLRQADRLEVHLGCGKRPLQVLVDGIENSEQSYTLVAEDRVRAIFGVARQTDTFGVVWLLGSDWLSEHPRVVLEGARKFLPILAEGFESVGNLIHNKQTMYLRFLEKLGFEFREHPEFPKEFLLFIGDFSHV